MAINTRLITVPEMQSFEDVRQAMARTLNDLQTSILSQLPITNMQGSRLSNVGAPVAADDAVTLKFLQSGVVSQPAPTSIVVSTNTGGGAGGGALVACEIPSGTIDGTNRTFSVTHTINPSPKPILELNGVVQDPLAATPDFTVDGNTFTYNVAPDASAVHVIWYWYGNAGNSTTSRARFFNAVNTDKLVWGSNANWFINGDLSVGFWIKPTGTSTSGRTIIFQGDASTGGNDMYKFYLSGSSGAWTIDAGHEDNSSNQFITTFAANIPDDTWKFIGIVRDATAKTYTGYSGDGATLSTLGTATYTTSVATGTANTSLSVGCQFNTGIGQNLPLTGTLEEHYIWSRKLTSTDIANAMKGTISTTNLQLWCKMGNTPEIDLSPTNASGAVTGTTLVAGHP